MPKTHTLTVQQLRCLASPAKRLIFEAVKTAGTATATEIALRVGRSASTVLCHFGALESVGLVKVVGLRPTDRRPERIFAPISARLRLPDSTPGSEIAIQARLSVVAGLRSTMRGFERASKIGSADVHVIYLYSRLNSRALRVIHEVLDEVAKFAKANETADGETFRWSSVVFPADP